MADVSDSFLCGEASATAQLLPPRTRITAPVGPSAAEWIMNQPYRVAIGSTWQYVATWPKAVEVAEWHGVEVELSPRHALEHPVMVDPYERAPVMRGPNAGQVALADAYGSSSGEE